MLKTKKRQQEVTNRNLNKLIYVNVSKSNECLHVSSLPLREHDVGQQSKYPGVPAIYDT